MRVTYQKGFAPIIFLLIILVAASGGYVVVKGNPSLIQKAIAPNLKIVGPSNLPSTAKVEIDKISVTGKYDFGNNQFVSYAFNLPKNGGQVNGQLTDACNAKISAEEAVPDKDGQSNISGRIEGECKLPALPFSAKLLVSFNGLVDFKTKKLSLNYTLEQPIVTSSKVEIPFNQSIRISSSSPNPSNQPVNSPISNTQVTLNQVSYSGVYQISNIAKVNYNVSFPRYGGVITGSGSGDCQATIKGQVDSNSAQGKRSISGSIQANCKSLAPATDQTVFNGTFWGSLDDSKGKIEIIHNGIFDNSSNGYLEATYIP